jgi:hypothetical protein
MNLKLKPAVKAVAETLHRSLFSYMQRMGFVLSAAHTAVEGFSDGSGTTYAITATLPATYDAAGYGATTITYTTIGKVESFPNSARRGTSRSSVRSPVRSRK